MRGAIGWIAPFGYMRARRKRQQEQLERARKQHLERMAAGEGGSRGFDYEVAVAALVDEGLSELQIREGSMPEDCLRWALDLVNRELSMDGPPLAVHVGNFVGLSLACFTQALRDLHDQALVLSVDPGVPHRGVEAPQRHTLHLLERFGLQRNSLVITGYSHAKNPRDDGLVWGADGSFSFANPARAREALAADAACEAVLPSLARLLEGRCDLVVSDGNHDADYLLRELQAIDRLLRPGGILILDDVGEGLWPGITDVFHELAGGSGFDKLGDNGRVGVLRRSAEVPIA